MNIHVHSNHPSNIAFIIESANLKSKDAVVTVFKTIHEETIGKALLRLGREGNNFKGVIIRNNQVEAKREGTNRDEVWSELRNLVGQGEPGYFGFKGAINRFLYFFPDGFQSASFAEHERDYKIAAKNKLEAAVPLEEALTGNGFGRDILRMFQATNLLSQFELPHIKEVLRSKSADDFVKAAARFTMGETKQAISDLESILRPHNAAKWTIVTYLPFLWRPEQHMFLKPEVTKDFAARVGHRFSHEYEARLAPNTYESLLDLMTTTRNEIASLYPRDGIDIQSFIWVVGYYWENEANDSNSGE